MKLNNENFELILFDLLEGNLPEKEKAMVLDQIENNPSWKKEWEMLKLTVLEVDEEIVYEHKATLIKNGGAARILAIFPKYSSWAAAAAILIVAWMFWPMKEVPNMNNTIVSQGVEPQKENTPLVAAIDTIVTEFVASNQNNINIKSKPKVENQITETKEEYYPIELNKTTDNVIVNQSKKVELVNNFTPEIPVVTLLLSPRIIPVSDANTTKETAESDVVYHEDAGLRKIVNSNINKALNPFKEPKFNIKTGVKENNPAIIMSFSSRAYSADAQFLLKTN